MALDTYANLKTSIANYLNRDDLTTYLPDFISLAEARHGRDLRLRIMESVGTASATGGQNYIDLPTNFLEFRYVALNTNPKIVLRYMSPFELTKNYGGNSSGEPIYFTIIGEKLYFGPTPDSSYSIEWAFYSKPTALSDSNTTNAILTNHPDLYLYASLLESSPFLMQDERLGVWAELYKEAVKVANSSDEIGRHSSGPLQMTAKSVG
tara:strand:+ start:447 stop:1070 length:624 start_codon:yes stop_codon:yes gene_type:complete